MKTKVLYVLVSNKKDIYLEQAFVSISSIRHHMGKEVEINILVDQITRDGLDDNRMKMLAGADSIITVELSPDLSAQNRSRILKTSCREYLEGDFIFIDCDTIITQPLANIDEVSGDIVACYDSHTLFSENPYRNLCISDSKKIGIDISKEEIYYNSGVILVRDTPKTHEFYKLWNRNWLEGRKKGVNMDQPSFNKTNKEMGYPVQCLDDIWNCEIIHGIRFLREAKIVHYLCTNVTSGKNQEIFLMRNMNVLQSIKQTGKIPNEIKECFNDPFKGIPPLTTLVAGKNNYLLRTPLYNYLLSHYGSISFMVLNGAIKTINRVKRYLTNKK